MDPQTFQERLRRSFDDRLVVERDKKDHCLVVWDQTRSGTRYPAYKVCCELHGAPALAGTPRDPNENDVKALHQNNWAEKYGGNKAAATSIFNSVYRDTQQAEEQAKQDELKRVVDEEVREKVEWRCGVRNTIAVTPKKADGTAATDTFTGDRRRRVS